MRLLWVDDQVEELEPVVRLLEGSGISIRTALTAEEGWRIVAEWHPHIALIDEHMPGEVGTVLISRVKRVYPFIYTVLVTYDAKSDLVEKAIKAGADMYLLKPVRLPELEAVIRRAVSEVSLVPEHMEILVKKARSANRWEEWFEVYGGVLNTCLPDHMYRQLQECFALFVCRNYEQVREGCVPVSHRVLGEVFREYVGGAAIIVVLDGMRLDQWKAIQKHVSREMELVYEGVYVALLPTVTWWCRKALLSGMLPSLEVLQMPESRAVGSLFSGREIVYLQVEHHTLRREIEEMEAVVARGGVVVLVLSLLDELIHELTQARAVANVLADVQSIAGVAAQWFGGSVLWRGVLAMVRRVKGVKVVFVSDHGWVRVTEPVAIVSEGGEGNYRWHTATQVTPLVQRGWVEFARGRLGLPSAIDRGQTVVAVGSHFLVFEGKEKRAIREYAGTLQHGGISLEEMIVPVAVYVSG